MFEKERFMFKQILASIAVATIAMVSPASSQQSPPTSEQAKRIEAMVNKAAALVERQGKAAFSEFRKRDSEWWFGNTYIFRLRSKPKCVTQPRFSETRGNQSSW